MQSASIAVIATVTVMLFSLGVAMVSTAERDDRSKLAAATAPAGGGGDEAAPGAPASLSPKPATPARRSARAEPLEPADAGAPAGSGGGQAPAPPGPESLAAPPSSAPVRASGQPPVRAEPAARELKLQPAAAGRWLAALTWEERDALDEFQQSGESSVYLHAYEPGADGQLLELEPSMTDVIGEVAIYDQSGRRLRELRLRTTRGTVAFRSPEGFLEIPRTLRIGESWTWSGASEDAGTTLDATTKVVAFDEFALQDGTRVEAVEYEWVATIGGDRSMRIERHVWFAPSLGVHVRIEEVATGTKLDGSPYEKRSEVHLVHAAPEREGQSIGVD